MLCLEGADELGSVEPFAVVLHGTQAVWLAQEPVDGRVLAAEIGGGADEVVAVGGHQTGDVGVRAVRTLGHAVEPRVHHVDGLYVAPRAARWEGVGAAGEHLVAALQQHADVVVAVLLRLSFILT